MEVFLMGASVLFLFFGSLLILSPHSFEKISKAANKMVVAVDEKIHVWRKPVGIIFLIVSIFLWYVAWSG